MLSACNQNYLTRHRPLYMNPVPWWTTRIPRLMRVFLFYRRFFTLCPRVVGDQVLRGLWQYQDPHRSQDIRDMEWQHTLDAACSYLVLEHICSMRSEVTLSATARMIKLLMSKIKIVNLLSPSPKHLSTFALSCRHLRDSIYDPTEVVSRRSCSFAWKEHIPTACGDSGHVTRYYLKQAKMWLAKKYWIAGTDLRVKALLAVRSISEVKLKHKAWHDTMNRQSFFNKHV